MRRLVLLALLVWAVAGCSERQPPKGLVARAELGVFFGGQVQQREMIPFCIDRSKQTQGFRIEFREMLRRPAQIRWEIDRPSRKGRVVELARAEARAGIDRFDQEIRFSPGDPLGVWNVRVLVDDQLVIDRPFEVYDADVRRRALREAEALHGPRASRTPGR